MDESLWQAIRNAGLAETMGATALDIDPAQVDRFYAPLAHRLIHTRDTRRRILVGIAGPPGSGKSTFAMILCAVINALLAAEAAVVVGQDGWHFPNAYLDTHFITRGAQTLPLRKIKGAPETFDANGLITFLERLAHAPSASFPQYSRELHEPVPDSGLVQPSHTLILVEGNYLLLQQEPWQPLLPLFRETISLTAPEEALLDGLRQRHLRGGKPPEIVEAHLREVDLPNIRLVQSVSARAGLTIEKSDSRTIVRVVDRQGHVVAGE